MSTDELIRTRDSQPTQPELGRPLEPIYVLSTQEVFDLCTRSRTIRLNTEGLRRTLDEVAKKAVRIQIRICDGESRIVAWPRRAGARVS